MTVPRPAPPEIRTGPYDSSADHVRDELARVHLYIQAETWRHECMTTASAEHGTWSISQGDSAELAAFRCAPFGAKPPEDCALGVGLRLYREALDASRQAIDDCIDQTRHLPVLVLKALRHGFGLAPLEQDLLLLTVLPQVDARYQRVLGVLAQEFATDGVVIDLILRMGGVAGHTREDVLAAIDRLVDVNLLELTKSRSASGSLVLREVSPARPALDVLLGRRALPELRPASDSDFDDLLIDDASRDALRSIAKWLHRECARRSNVLFFHGPYGSDRRRAAMAVARSLDSSLLVIDTPVAHRDHANWSAYVTHVYAAARCESRVPYWSRSEYLLRAEGNRPDFQCVLAAAEAHPGVSFFASDLDFSPVERFLEVPFVRFEFAPPSYDLRVRIWEQLLADRGPLLDSGVDTRASAQLLANGFQLTPGQVRDAIASARWAATRRSPTSPRIALADLHDGARRQSTGNLTRLARRVEPISELRFTELILPPQSKRQLEELRVRIERRGELHERFGFARRLPIGRGLVALFTGASGTGKTMAASLLASGQGVYVYKADLSALVSKWLGETEQNLDQLFREAENTNALLFFDEADALFGKRGDVKEARDRWANLEVNFLLQRIEEYSGVVVLATNLRQNIDEAFLRRIHVLVDFPFPDADARFEIWKGLFPPKIERPSDPELRDLAERFELSGGSLKNVVVDASFRALGEIPSGCVVRIAVRHLVLSIAREFQKLGRPLLRGDFGPGFYEWVQAEILASCDEGEASRARVA